jgi:serine/threonine protein phosphatase PrpC
MTNQLKTSSEIYNGFEILCQTETRQLGSRQDHSAYGSYNTELGKTIWGVALDGHGKNQAIHKIRGANLDEIMKLPTPWTHLQELLDSDTTVLDSMKINSGSTMVLTKIHLYEHETQVVVSNIGDSTGVVFVNDVPVFMTTSHSYNNACEIVRLIQENRVDLDSVHVKEGSDFEIISPTTLRSIVGIYVSFKTPIGEKKLAMTQSLGHMGYTGLKPDTTIIRCKPTDRIRVCMCSDGVSDMLPVNGLDSHDTFSFMSSTTTALLDEAERRWKQTWIVQQNTDLRNEPKTKFPSNGYDDCCCTMLTVQKEVCSSQMELPPASPTADIEETFSDVADTKILVEDDIEDIYS